MWIGPERTGSTLGLWQSEGETRLLPRLPICEAGERPASHYIVADEALFVTSVVRPVFLLDETK